MKNFSIWSRSRLFSPGAGADPSWSEPESAPGPWPSGAGARAAQKSGGSATLCTFFPIEFGKKRPFPLKKFYEKSK